MKTLGSRLAFLYSFATSLTLIAVLSIGFWFYWHRLIINLDGLLDSEAARIAELAGPVWDSGSAGRISDHLQESKRAALPTFVVQVTDAGGHLVFTSAIVRIGSLHATLSLHGSQNIENGVLGRLRVVRRALPGGGAVTIAASIVSLDQEVNEYATISIFLASLTLIISLVAGFCLSHFALRPLRDIQETAYRIHSDNLGERIKVSDVNDEISELARLLNEMFDRLESAFEQVRRFSGEASHELKTPLSILRLQTERLLVETELTPAQEAIVQAQMDEIESVRHIIEQLLFLSKAEAKAIVPEIVFGDPTPTLKAVIDDARLLAEDAGLRLEDKVEGHLAVSFDPKWLRQIVLNVISNSLRYAPRGSLILVHSRYEMDNWVVTVEDHGRGVPAGDLERIFERFVRIAPDTGSRPEGSGLGLAICRSMMELMGGRIHAELPDSGPGLRVICQFSLERKTASHPSPESGEPGPAIRSTVPD